MSAKLAHCHRHERGMTLIELLTVMVILAVLSSVAVASYRSYMIRANRTDGRTTLLRIQVAEEKFFLQNNTYTTELGPTGLRISKTDATSMDTPAGFYTVKVVKGSTNDIASSYSASATAQSGQTKDTSACLTLTIDDQGQKTPGDSSGCWK